VLHSVQNRNGSWGSLCGVLHVPDQNEDVDLALFLELTGHWSDWGMATHDLLGEHASITQ
jgi:hypothetical protein